MMIIENNTTWNTQELKKLFSLISKHEGYYPRKIYIVYSRKRGIISGRGTIGPGWVKMRLPNKMHIYGALCTLGELSGSMLQNIAQTYIHELDHNRKLMHKDMVYSSKINVNYVKGIKIHRSNKQAQKQKSQQRKKLANFKYGGYITKIYKYPWKVTSVKKGEKIPGIGQLFDEIMYGYWYTFIIYKNGKKVYNRKGRRFFENISKVKTEIKEIIKRRQATWKKYQK